MIGLRVVIKSVLSTVPEKNTAETDAQHYSKNPYIRTTFFGVRLAKAPKLQPFKKKICPACR